MNTPTPYETLIAVKLEQLPVPDMANSIWASIEMQLDAGPDLDNDDTTPSNKPTTGKPGMGKGFYLSIFSAIIIAIIIIIKTNKKQNNNNPLPAIPATATVAPAADSNHTAIPATEKNNRGTTIPAGKKDANVIPGLNDNRINFDSVKPLVITPTKVDTAAQLKDKPVLPVFDSAVKPPLQKPKGIKGITPDDYKIQGSKKNPGKKEG